MKKSEINERLYDPKYYGPGYYGGGERGGFRAYDFNSGEQREQLGLKFLSAAAVPHRSALFVGCATGFEVAYWRRQGIDAVGYDVSEWAIANQIPEAEGKCFLYSGDRLPVGPNFFDLVACFDVLPHLPDEMRESLAASMVAVARAGIVWRQIVKNWRNLGEEVDGLDGAWFRYDRFEIWDERFTRSGKFKLLRASTSASYEVTAVYARK